MSTDNRIAALAKYLECDPGEIYDHGGWELEHGRASYLVLTDEEADQKAREYIEESVWAFNIDFLAGHIASSDGMSFDDAKEVVTALQPRCEDANRPIRSLIRDFDHFVEDAIRADGRAHFLATYDGEEVEAGEFFVYRVN
jgi:hypothetical protein